MAALLSFSLDIPLALTYGALFFGEYHSILVVVGAVIILSAVVLQVFAQSSKHDLLEEDSEDSESE